MSKMSYGASLRITVHTVVNGKPGPVEFLKFPVRSFEVRGGASRVIELATTNEGKIAAEMEHARLYKNVILYLKSGYGTPHTELINLSKSGKKEFSIAVTVTVHDDSGVPVRRYDLQSSVANFGETPTPVGSTPAGLKTRLLLSTPKVLHGYRDEQRGADVMEEV